MKIKIFLASILFLLISGTFSQITTLELTFTAIDSAAYIQMDSIKVMNRTQGGDTVLYWPDTVLSLDFAGIPENSELSGRFQVFQNNPNPVTDQATISLYVPEKDRVYLIVSDMLGRVILKTEKILEEGRHSFRYTPGNGNLFFFTARWRGYGSSIKILCNGLCFGGSASLEYSGSKCSTTHLKAAEATSDFAFTPGDTLLFIGYTDSLQSGMLNRPEQSQTYSFQFAFDIPCPGTQTVTYEGQVYNTIQIFSQCWLKENLNVGMMIEGSDQMTDNDTIEKYCYDNDPMNCSIYGGLYQWNEMMQYTTQLGAQGICPPGWHLPTDEEWKVLEGAIDSQYRTGDPEWDWWDMRGSDIGIKIKSTTGWDDNWNGTDTHGFKLMPGGFRYFNDGKFYHAGGHANMWSSNSHTSCYKWYRFVIGYIKESYRNSAPLDDGYSIRCIQN